MNIFLIEDEPPILRDLKQTIISFGSSYRVVGEAYDGKDALEQICKNAEGIDVVITDIQIPMMNGLQVIEQLRSRSNSLKYIILSGYSEFSYAKQAIQMGVAEYLLKPVKEAELLAVLEKISKDNLKAYLKEGLNTDVKAEETVYHCAIAVMGAYRNNAEYENEYQEFLQEFDPEHYWVIRGNNTNERYIIFPDGEFTSCQVMFRSMTEHAAYPVTVLIHPDELLIGDIKQAIRHLCKRISRYIILGKKQIIVEGKLPKTGGTEALYKKLELVKARFTHSTLEEFKQELWEWFLLAEESGTTQESVMRYCYDLLEHCLEGEHSMGIVDLLEEVMAFTYDFATLFANLYYICMDAYREGGEGSRDLKEMKEGFISEITVYLYENYMNNISIAVLGGYFHYSGSYISKIFREAKGISILEYLLAIRIEKAKELLCQSGFRIKDVSSMVGYEDSLYFSKVFKKKEGVSPLEWQRRAIDCHEGTAAEKEG